MNFWNSIIISSFLLISSISIYGIAKDKSPFSLNKIFWIFCLLFMGLAPLLQYISGVHPFPWMENQDNLQSFAHTNAIIIVGMINFLIVNKMVSKKSSLSAINKVENEYSERTIAAYKGRGNLIFVAAILLQILIAGDLWNRGAAEGNIIISNSTLQLFADKTLKGLVLYFCLLTIHFYKEKKISKLQLVFVLLLTVVANFPAAIPRYWFAALYLGIIITAFRPFFIRRKNLFSLLLILSTIILFPLLNLTRWSRQNIERYSSSFENAFSGFKKLFKDAFCSQDFDAYASLRNTVLYMDQHSISWGKQVATVVLFFIPRSIWPGKSIGSGALVNTPRPHSDFNNYCSPLFAEGYINFGLVGVILFLGLFSFICTKYDYLYQMNRNNSFAIILYPAFLGMSFFILRGDLLSSFAYTIGILCSGYIFHRIIVFKLKQN